MKKLETVLRLCDNRLAIVYHGDVGVKVVKIQADKSPKELLHLTPSDLQRIADAEFLPEGITFEEGLAIVLTWMSNK